MHEACVTFSVKVTLRILLFLPDVDLKIIAAFARMRELLKVRGLFLKHIR